MKLSLSSPGAGEAVSKSVTAQALHLGASGCNILKSVATRIPKSGAILTFAAGRIAAIEASIWRLVGAILMEQTEEWTV
jgi:hypothetical protein